MPKISVIVPVYNVEKWLQRCIDSILGQTYKDFELILVDDGSSDNSGAICDDYAKKDGRIKVIHKDNGGVSSARNVGIDSSAGEYIMFVDSDDSIDSAMLENMLLGLNDSVDLVISSIEMIINNKNYVYVVSDGVKSSSEFLSDYCNEKFPKICFCGPVCKLYKKEIIDRYNLRFNVELNLGEDTYFNFSYIQYCAEVFTISKPYYFYFRENVNSLFSKFQKNTHEQSATVFDFSLWVMQKMKINQDLLEKYKYNHVRSLIGYLIKAYMTSDKKTFLYYLKQLSTDKYLKKYYKHFPVKEKTVAYFILKKHYGTVYTIYRIWNMKDIKK